MNFSSNFRCSIFLLFRMGMESASKIRRHENTSSSEEDDLVDLLGNTCQVYVNLNHHKMSSAYWFELCNKGFVQFFRVQLVFTMTSTVSQLIIHKEVQQCKRAVAYTASPTQGCQFQHMHQIHGCMLETEEYP